MLELTLRHDGHVTKNCYRFEEIDTDTNKPKEKGEQIIINELYISKFAFHFNCPDEITIKMEW